MGKRVGSMMLQEMKIISYSNFSLLLILVKEKKRAIQRAIFFPFIHF